MTINKNQAEKQSNDAENCKPYFYTIILSPQAQKSKLVSSFYVVFVVDTVWL